MGRNTLLKHASASYLPYFWSLPLSAAACFLCLLSRKIFILLKSSKNWSKEEQQKLRNWNLPKCQDREWNLFTCSCFELLRLLLHQLLLTLSTSLAGHWLHTAQREYKDVHNTLNIINWLCQLGERSLYIAATYFIQNWRRFLLARQNIQY